MYKLQNEVKHLSMTPQGIEDKTPNSDRLYQGLFHNIREGNSILADGKTSYRLFNLHRYALNGTPKRIANRKGLIVVSSGDLQAAPPSHVECLELHFASHLHFFGDTISLDFAMCPQVSRI